MTDTIHNTILPMTETTAEPEDYTGEDGLLYCGKCRKPKEAYFPEGKTFFGRDRHPSECDCQRAARKEREAAEKQLSHLETVERLKRQGFTDKTMQDWTFDNDNGSCPQMKSAAGYVERWEQIKDGNYGLLLWGRVGTGKSYFAGCIANALMEQEVPVCMTNFAAILNDLAASFAGRNEYISRLCSFPLLIIDDFGMSRLLRGMFQSSNTMMTVLRRLKHRRKVLHSRFILYLQEASRRQRNPSATHLSVMQMDLRSLRIFLMVFIRYTRQKAGKIQSS